MSLILSRREIIAAAGAAAVGFGTRADANPGREAHGFVFESAGARTHRQPGDKGIAGVMVSNGRDVVLTRQDGGWSLPLRPADQIFVIKPAHWRTPLGTGGIPRFSHALGPAADDGPLLASIAGPHVSIDFPLVRQDEPETFQALLVTDTQPDSHEELNYVRDDIIAGFLDRPAAFGIHHGDVVGDSLDLYPRYLQLLGATGLTWHHCSGNHDIDRDASDNSSSRETWTRTFGPRHYAFQHASATFLVLDNVDYLGRAEGRYCGRFGPDQLQFVRNVLAHVREDQLVVLSMHIPLRCHLDPANPADTTSDYLELLRLLRGRPHTVSFAGHLHATEHHYLDDPAHPPTAHRHHHHVLTAASGSWWSGPRDHRGIPCADSTDGTPNGFHVLTVEGNRYATEFVPAVGKRIARLRATIEVSTARPSDGGALRKGAGLAVQRRDLAQSRLVVNVFDGGPRTRVQCRFSDQSAWMGLEATAMPDPLACRLFEADGPRKDWVKPTLSSHIWRLPLPANLRPGAQRVDLKIIDEYGRAFTDRLVMEVAEA